MSDRKIVRSVVNVAIYSSTCSVAPDTRCGLRSIAAPWRRPLLAQIYLAVGEWTAQIKGQDDLR